MTHMTWRARARRSLAVLVTAALGGALLTATGAVADTVGPAPTGAPGHEVTGGSAEWGVKE